MSVRLTRLVALAAMVTHIWVNLIAAPWHHLVAHQLPAPTQTNHRDAGSRSEHCHCHHHSHCHSTSQANVSDSQSSRPSDTHQHDDGLPHDDDSCPVCQLLTQHSARLEMTLEIPTRTPRLLAAIELVIQPALGSLIDPVSRGPPTA